ncbi:MAG TPA: hypothetical protein VEV83_15805 [Parafilimonas sp.]|nr:hypothetical protein [Parafilimonas sp.]
MKTNKFLLLVILVFSACSKQDSNAIRSGAVNNSATVFTDTVMVPINDLGTGTYFGFTAGLYPGGLNYPTLQYKKDLKTFASAIKPLNGSGAVDSAVGKIVFISLGGSTSGHLMRVLKDSTINDVNTNPFLKLINCSDGSGTASFESISNPNDSYWDHVSNVIITSRAYPKQVQVIYMETEDSIQVTTFPNRPNAVKGNIEAAVRTCKLKYPNLKLVYFLGRTTTFPDSTNNLTQTTNKEPCLYYNGWACKFAIEDQINGAPGTEYKGSNPVAPIMTWGWYEWANGTNVPRQDGFTWQASDTKDGLHATDAGEDTLVHRFKTFLMTDTYAKIWYKKKRK